MDTILGTMPSYRLKPRLSVWKIAGVVTVLLLAPSLINLTLPRLADDKSQVILGQSGYDWELPVSWPEGEPLVCEEVDDLLMPGWSCEDATINALIFEDVEDPENSMKRAIRAITMFPAGEGEFLTDGDVHLFEGQDSIALSLPGTGEHEGKTMIAVVSGEQRRPYSALILRTMRGGEGPLPRDISEIGAAA